MGPLGVLLSVLPKREGSCLISRYRRRERRLPPMLKSLPASDLGVRRHDCQALPPSTYTIVHRGQASLSMFVYPRKHLVIGPVNHGYTMEVPYQSLCSNRVSGHLCSCSHCDSRKGTSVRKCFTEPPINMLCGSSLGEEHTEYSCY